MFGTLSITFSLAICLDDLLLPFSLICIYSICLAISIIFGEGIMALSYTHTHTHTYSRESSRTHTHAHTIQGCTHLMSFRSICHVYALRATHRTFSSVSSIIFTHICLSSRTSENTIVLMYCLHLFFLLSPENPYVRSFIKAFIGIFRYVLTQKRDKFRDVE